MTYEISGFYKTAEIDNWENGCQLDGGHDTWIDYRIKAETIEEMKDRILSFVGANSENMEVDACDEIGRIDVQKTENNEGYDPTSREMSEFKEGKINLWLVTYTCYVEKVTREPAILI